MYFCVCVWWGKGKKYDAKIILRFRFSGTVYKVDKLHKCLNVSGMKGTSIIVVNVGQEAVDTDCYPSPLF